MPINPVFTVRPSSIFYPANGSDFDGSTTYLSKGSSIYGSDSSQGILSVWIKRNTPSFSQKIINITQASPTAYMDLGDTGSDHFRVDLRNDTNLLVFATNNAYSSTSAWIHILISWDVNFSSGNRLYHMYINDISDKTLVSESGTAFNIPYSTMTTNTIGATSFPAQFLKCSIAELYFRPGSYLDLSVIANRRKFISATKRPIYLGSDGSVPTGSTPALYMKNPSFTFNKNYGTGGNFTVNGTPPSNPSISPSGDYRYYANASTFDSTDKMNNTTAISASDSVTISVWIRFNSSSTTQQQVFSYSNSSASAGLISLAKESGGNKLFLQIFNTISNVYTIRTANDYTNANGWIHVLASVNTNFSSGNRISTLYISDVSDKVVSTDTGAAFQALTNNSGAPFQIGSNDYFSSRYFDGSMAELYISQVYTDFTVESNRRKFISSTLKPVDLGSNGSLPSGSQPLIYLKGVGTGFNVNSGTFGNFTTTGTLTLPITSPSD